MAKKIKELEDEISQLISEKDKYLNISKKKMAGTDIPLSITFFAYKLIISFSLVFILL